MAARFHRAHERRNGFARPLDPIEVVTARVAVIGRPALRWQELPPVQPAGEPNRGTRSLAIDGGVIEASVWWRPGLRPDAEIVGPAVIEEAEATTFLGVGDRAVVHESGALVVEW